MTNEPPNEEKTVQHAVLELNFEVSFFNEKLRSLQIQNSIDLNLAKQLQQTMALIEGLLENPKVIHMPNALDIGSGVFEVHRQLFCKPCNQALKASGDKIADHICLARHTKNVTELKKKPTASQVFTNSQLHQSQNVPNGEAAPGPARKEGPVLQRNRTESEPAGQGEFGPFKLNKKVKTFLSDYRLERVAEELLIEGLQTKAGKTHETISEMLLNALRGVFPNVQVFTFGSRLNGLGCAESDLDVFVDLNFNYANPPWAMTGTTMRTVESCLRKTNQWTEFFPVLAARTPILRAFNIPEKVDCDLSFSNGLSHCNTKLINYFTVIQPLFAKVTVFLKLYAQRSEFHMNSYIITLLVVFYFQTENLLPPVVHLQENIPPILIGPWQSNFEAEPWPHKSTNFQKYLIGFFNFYANFNFRDLVVCPFLGAPLRKSQFSVKDEALPKEFWRYTEYMKELDIARCDSLLCIFAYEKDLVIQDPLELIHNVAKGVRKRTLERFVNYCKATASFLKTKKVF